MLASSPGLLLTQAGESGAQGTTEVGKPSVPGTLCMVTTLPEGRQGVHSAP